MEIRFAECLNQVTQALAGFGFSAKLGKYRSGSYRLSRSRGEFEDVLVFRRLRGSPFIETQFGLESRELERAETLLEFYHPSKILVFGDLDNLKRTRDPYKQMSPGLRAHVDTIKRWGPLSKTTLFLEQSDWQQMLHINDKQPNLEQPIEKTIATVVRGVEKVALRAFDISSAIDAYDPKLSEHIAFHEIQADALVSLYFSRRREDEGVSFLRELNRRYYMEQGQFLETYGKVANKVLTPPNWPAGSDLAETFFRYGVNPKRLYT